MFSAERESFVTEGSNVRRLHAGDATVPLRANSAEGEDSSRRALPWHGARFRMTSENAARQGRNYCSERRVRDHRRTKAQEVTAIQAIQASLRIWAALSTSPRWIS